MADTKLAKFRTGQVVMTPGVADLFEGRELEMLLLLNRHVRGDWGDTHPDDEGLNDQALIDGDRLLSVYKNVAGTQKTVWIITEADRASTCLLYPEDY